MLHTPAHSFADPHDRRWIAHAVEAIKDDARQSVETPLIKLDQARLPGIDIYLKDESAHPTGSLKHRLARSLFLYGLCNGWIAEGRPIIDASSGSTAISEAYFARLIGSPFIAVVPERTSPAKIAAIRAMDGAVRLSPSAATIERTCRDLAAETGGVFLDQFTNAERAIDWRGGDNIARRLFEEMSGEPRPVPDWIVVGAGTGGTAATIGRHIRFSPLHARRSRLCVVDPEGSALLACFENRPHASGLIHPSSIEGIGRPTIPRSFLPQLIDRMLLVSDEQAVAATLWLEEAAGLRCGPSTGANLVGVARLARRMATAGQTGSLVSLICDKGDRYGDTVFCPEWRAATLPGLSAWAAFHDTP